MLQQAKARLYTRPRKDGGKTIYISWYENGKRIQKSTGLFLVKEQNAGDKARNAVIWDDANILRAKKDIESITGNPDVQSGRLKGVQKLKDEVERFLAAHTTRNYTNAMTYLLDQMGAEARVRDLTPEAFNRIKAAVRQKTSGTTPHLYMTIVKIFIKELIEHGKLNADLKKYKLPPKVEAANKTRLTPEEIKRIAMAEIPNASHKYRLAFLFSYHTGLRFVDVVRVTKSNIVDGMIEIRLQKTQSNIRIPINKNAQSILDELDENLFSNLSGTSTNRNLKMIAAKAGIRKKLTFHVARVSFATNALIAGVGVYKVMRLLGHKDIKTTEIYLKIADDYLDKSTEALEF